MSRALATATARATARVVAATLLIAIAVLLAAPHAQGAMTIPRGSPISHEPSGMAPPGPAALSGYHLSYVNDFNSPGVPAGWYLYSGHPGGITTTSFSPRHVVFAQGLLRIKTYRDRAFANQWTTGGLCQCGQPLTYGAFFVRSRITAGSVNSVELLWPYRNASWPPEVDFNENLGYTILTSATTHWGVVNHFEATRIRINMLKWHTWGVIWTPTYLLYVVDGHPWHEFAVSGEVPTIPMTLDFESRAQCPSTFECPAGPSDMLIDWVAEYQR